MKNRTRPPKRSRILLNTSLSNSACCLASRNGTGLPSRLQPVDLEADLERLVEDLLLDAALGRLHGDDPAVGLLEDARRGAHEGRADDGEVVDDLVDAAVDRRGEAARRAGSTAAPCRTSAPSAATGTAGRSRRGCPAPGSRRPRRSTTCAAAARPWAGRSCRRCRSGWRATSGVVAVDRGPRRRPGCSASSSSPSFSRSARPITQSPSVVPSKVTTLVEVRQLGLALDAAWRSGCRPRRTPPGTRSRPGCRRRRRPSSRGRPSWSRPPAHMIARSARIHSKRVPEAMPTRCSGSMPERDQAGRQLGDVVAGLLPGLRLPALALRVAVGLPVRRRGHPVEELPADVRRRGSRSRTCRS